MTLVGLEPTISGSVDRCLIHWATGPNKGFTQSSWIYMRGKNYQKKKLRDRELNPGHPRDRRIY